MKPGELKKLLSEVAQVDHRYMVTPSGPVKCHARHDYWLAEFDGLEVHIRPVAALGPKMRHRAAALFLLSPSAQTWGGERGVMPPEGVRGLLPFDVKVYGFLDMQEALNWCAARHAHLVTAFRLGWKPPQRHQTPVWDGRDVDRWSITQVHFADCP